MFGFIKEIKDLRRRVELLERSHLSAEACNYYQYKYNKVRKRNYAKAKKIIMEKGTIYHSDSFCAYRRNGDLRLIKSEGCVYVKYEAYLGDFSFNKYDAEKLWDFCREVEEVRNYA